MRRLLFLAIVLLSGPALDALPAVPIQILGPVKEVPPQCADPTYACQDLQNARQCGVVNSCIHDIWATMSAPDDNEDICELCKEMVKEARDQLLSNMTQEELKEVFEGSCKLLRVEMVVDGCIKLVDEFIPELVEMLASRMDPNMVCTVAGLCNMAHLPIEEHFQNLLNLAVLNLNTDRCQECVVIITDVKAFVENSTEADFNQMCEKLCKQAKMELCDFVCGKFSPAIYSYIKTCDPKSVCASANVCPSENKIEIPPPKKNVGDDLVCQFCTNVLKHVKDMITANTTKEEFRTALRNFCTILGKFATECKTLVDDYYDTIFDALSKLDTKEVCTVIGLCQSGEYHHGISPLVKLFPAETLPKHPKMAKLTQSLPVQKNIDFQPMVKLVPAKQMSKKPPKNVADIETNDIFGNPENVQLSPERLTVPWITINRDLDCSFCKAISFFLEQDLGNNRTRGGVSNAMGKVCDKWVEEFPEQCRSFLEKYSDHVVDHITTNGDFDVLCTHVKACPLQEKETGVGVRVISPSPAPTGNICDFCKEIFDEVDNLMKNPDIQKGIKQFLEQVCQICPSKSKDKCISTIDQNVDKVLTIIEKNLQGDVACPALHMCPAGSKVALSSPVKSMECELCKDLVQQLVDALKDPQAKNATRSAIENACSHLPDISAMCKDFVDKHFDEYYDEFISALNPDAVCAILKICPGSGKVVTPPESNDVECDICKEVVQKIENNIRENRTKAAIEDAIKKVCDYLPKSMTSKCEQFVDNYMDLLINLLMSELQPNEVCAALKMCPQPPEVEQPENSLNCDMCKEMMSIVENDLQDKKVQDDIKNALIKICSVLPRSASTHCQSFFNTYTDLFISLMVKEMDPTMVCAAFNVCPKKGLGCVLCQDVLHYIQNQLASNDTQVMLKDGLEKFCDMFHGPYRDNCKAFVDEYSPALFALLAEELDPSVICPELNICPGVDKSVQKVAPERNIKFDKCEICVTVVGYVDKLLEEDSVDQEITQLVENVCKVVPQKLKASCNSIIATYGPYILQMIGQVADANQVCQDIDLCARTAGHVHLLGGQKCTFGPSYWCQTKAHAAACRAEMYCKQKIWKN